MTRINAPMDWNKYFFDTSSFIHAFNRTGDVKRFHAIVKNEKNIIFTSREVFGELRYKILWLAASKRLGSTKKYAVIDFLKKNTSFQRECLNKYFVYYFFIRDNFNIVGHNDHLEKTSAAFAITHGLLPVDASIVAQMAHNGIKNIVTTDSDFKKVDWINVIEV